MCLLTDGEENDSISECGRAVKAARTLGLPISSSLDKVCSLTQNKFRIHFYCLVINFAKGKISGLSRAYKKLCFVFVLVISTKIKPDILPFLPFFPILQGKVD